MSWKRTPNNKRLLFIGGPADAVPAIAHAWALGYDVVIADGNPDCAGGRWAGKQKSGVRFIQASTYDSVEIIENLPPIELSGVVAVACDVGPVVSHVADKLGLPHIPEEIARLGWNKVALKVALLNKIKTPEMAALLMLQDYVIKPIDGRGATGASLVQLDRHASPSGKYLAERYIPGPQVSAEAIVWEGQIVFCGFTDRHYNDSKIIEAGGSGPCAYEFQLKDFPQQIVSALGVESGTIKLDIVLENRETPYLIETAIGRMGGGFNVSHYLPICYGVDFLAAAYQVACGEPPELKRRKYPPRYCSGHYQTTGAEASHRERGRFKFLMV